MGGNESLLSSALVAGQGRLKAMFSNESSITWNLTSSPPQQAYLPQFLATQGTLWPSQEGSHEKGRCGCFREDHAPSTPF